VPTISDQSIIKLLPLERRALERLLALTGRELSPEDLELLRQQLATAIILSREMTGVGFYTTFRVDKDARRLPKRESFWFGAVGADVPGLEHGAGFQLYIKEGAVDQLEGFCYGESWPDPWPGCNATSEGGRFFDIARQRERKSR
jgi:hypothetical protein